MSTEISGIDQEDLGTWAFAQMYQAMRDAERYSASYKLNDSIIQRSKLGDRSIPRPQDLEQLAGNTKFFMQRAEMYASIFAACELADDSPNRDKYVRAIQAVDRQRAGNLIPKPRTP